MGATVCGHDLGKSAHICAFFDSEKEEYACLVPYFTEGLAQGEQVLSIRDLANHGEHLRHLEEGGLPVKEAIADSRFRMKATEDTYLKDECFDHERMLSLLQEALAEGRENFTSVRACGDMSWALRNVSGTDQLMEYEARVNTLLPQNDCTLMCVYDINKFSGKVLMDALSTHRHVLVNGKVVENQYFVEPMQYLTSRLHRTSSPVARETPGD